MMIASFSPNRYSSRIWKVPWLRDFFFRLPQDEDSAVLWCSTSRGYSARLSRLLISSSCLVVALYSMMMSKNRYINKIIILIIIVVIVIVDVNVIIYGVHTFTKYKPQPSGAPRLQSINPIPLSLHPPSRQSGPIPQPCTPPSLSCPGCPS